MVLELRIKEMATITKFDIPNFDGKMSFNIWKVQMMTVLTQNGLKKALDGDSKKPKSMTDEEWLELDERALSPIQLCFMPHVKYLNKQPRLSYGSHWNRST